MSTQERSHNLLIVSDMHIAEGLLAEEGESTYGHEAFLYDGAFARFLRYHEEMRRDAVQRWKQRTEDKAQGKTIDEAAQQQDEVLKRPWRLVLAGDVFDFWDVVRVPGDLEALRKAIDAEAQKLSGQPLALQWLEGLRVRLDEAERGRPGTTPDYDDIRGELDRLGPLTGRQRRAVEAVTWWTEVLVQKPGVKLSRQESLHGLGTTWQEVVWKLDHIYRGHREFFGAMAWFIACGNQMVLLKGNHDVELHWPQVHNGHFPHVLWDAYQDLHQGKALGPTFGDYGSEWLLDLYGQPLPDGPGFKGLLPEYRSASGSGGGRTQQAGLGLVFEDWFHYEKDLAYVEHGNQYEPADSSVYFLAPLTPADQERIELPWGAFMVRAVYNKIVAVHPFAVNVKPEERIVHWMVQHDLFRILGLVLAELPDILRALWRAVQQGFRGSWIWGDHSMLGLIPLLVYDLIQILTPGMWQGERDVQAADLRRRTEIAEAYSGAKGITMGAAQSSKAGKGGLVAGFLLHLGALGGIVCLLLFAGGGLFGWAWTGWLAAPLILFGIAAAGGGIWSLGVAGPDARHRLGQLLLQVGVAGMVAGLMADLFLAKALKFGPVASLLAVLVPLGVAAAGGVLLWTAHGSQRKAVGPQLFRRGWPAQALRSGASLLLELGLLSSVVAICRFDLDNVRPAVPWLLTAIALFTWAWVGDRLRALYINRRWLERLIDRWLESVQRGVRSVCTVVVVVATLPLLVSPVAGVVEAVGERLYESTGIEGAKEIAGLAHQAYDALTSEWAAGLPGLVLCLLAIGAALVLQKALRWFIELFRGGRLHGRVSVMPLQPLAASLYRQGPGRGGGRSVSAPVVAEQLEEIRELARSEQRRWLGSLLSLLTLILPIVALILLAVAVVGSAASFFSVVSPIVEPFKALGLSALFGFGFWLVRQISASTQRHDPVSGFGDLFYRMAVSVADILDEVGTGAGGGGLGRPRYLIFGHDHWADAKPLAEREAQDPRLGRQWYVNSGTWLRGYVEEEQRQEVNENHSTFVQILPDLSDEEAPRVLRWNDGANQPEPIVRREEPRSASKLLWDRWEERWPWVLAWAILLAAVWALAPGMMTELRSIGWATGLGFVLWILGALGRRLWRATRPG